MDAFLVARFLNAGTKKQKKNRMQQGSILSERLRTMQPISRQNKSHENSIFFFQVYFQVAKATVQQGCSSLPRLPAREAA